MDQPTSLPSLRPLVMWAVTYRCNLRCKYCYLFTNENLDSLRHPEAPSEVVKAITRVLTSDAWKPEAVWLTGGEPTLHPDLLSIIETLEASGIMSIVTTDGAIAAETAKALVDARPRGIMVSLDLADPSANDYYRGRSADVLRTIEIVSARKTPYTTLGVATVVTSANASHLPEFSRWLSERDIEYLSLNPLHDHNGRTHSFVPNTESARAAASAIDGLRDQNEIKRPSDVYLSLLKAHLSAEAPASLQCPATHEYVFIAPWGQVYPCSDEFWHHDVRMVGGPLASDGLTAALEELRTRLGRHRYSTASHCYSTRCMGCWKLYYDSVFVAASR